MPISVVPDFSSTSLRWGGNVYAAVLMPFNVAIEQKSRRITLLSLVFGSGVDNLQYTVYIRMETTTTTGKRIGDCCSPFEVCG